MDKLILFGGAFDPIHNGHLHIADKASKMLDSDVLFIPAHISVWKEQSVSPQDKLKMVELAIKDYPRFKVSDYELKLADEKNFTIHTVRYFHKLYPDTKLYFLIGSDHVDLFHKWNDADELASIAQIVFFNRPNYEAHKENIERFHMKEIPGEEIIADSTSIRTFNILPLPKEVIYYIEEHELYYMPQVKSYFNNEKRYLHSKSVARLCLDIALSNKVSNPGNAYIAGLLHDIGKSVDKERAIKLMEEIAPEYIDIGPWSYHQFIGADFAKKDFNIPERTIISAIKYHATGNEKMYLIGKIVYAADKLDPLRDYDSSYYISLMMKNAKEGFVSVLKANKEFLESHNKDNHNELTSKCYDYYLKD